MEDVGESGAVERCYLVVSGDVRLVTLELGTLEFRTLELRTLDLGALRLDTLELGTLELVTLGGGLTSATSRWVGLSGSAFRSTSSWKRLWLESATMLGEAMWRV